MSLLSLEFLLLATTAIVLLRFTRGALRWIGFVALSVWYAHTFLGTGGLTSTLIFCLAGYIAAQAAVRHGRAVGLGVVILSAAFLYMQDYAFLRLVLPEDWRTNVLATAGLSFLFFRVLHVVIDAGSGTLGTLRPSDYLAYCFNFTTFLMGPIQRYQDFVRQWRGEDEPLPPKFEPHVDALNRLLRGLIKKYVLAELLARYALLPGSDVAGAGAAEVLGGTYLFYLYLYLDFSGYCDVVIAIGSLMGIRPPENFFLPFFAGNVAEYWLRVHRSLTHWLTDYIFNPLYARLLRTARAGVRALWPAPLAVFITMIIAGLWHGTTGNFLLFGLVHGVYLAVFRLFEIMLTARLGRPRLRDLRGQWWWRGASTVLTFNATAAAYLFFVLDTATLTRWFTGS